MFERENRREKIIESKMREMRLRMRTRQEIPGQKEAAGSTLNADNEAIEQATKEFFLKIKQVRNEIITQHFVQLIVFF